MNLDRGLDELVQRIFIISTSTVRNKPQFSLLGLGLEL